MKRAVIIILCGAVLGLLAGAGIYITRTASQRAMLCCEQPELAWLQQKFKLTDAQFASVKKLHTDYVSQCAELCDRIAATNVRVFQNRQNFNPQYRFVTWLYTIATNLARTQQRWQSRHPQVSLEAESEFTDGSLKDRLPAETADAAEHLETAERKTAVRDAIAGLPEELREPLILAEYEEMSQREIAEILQCTPKAVEMRLYHARQQLRRSLAKYF